MNFCEQLNDYIKQIGCSSQELVTASGLTTSVISRYRRGDRNPNIRSKQLEQLVDGLYKLSNLKELNITRDEIYITLSNTLNDISIDFEQLNKNFNELITTLNVNMAELSRSSTYDSSLLSKIRTGNRNPAKPKDFIETVCNFIVKKYKTEDDKKAVALLIGSTLEELKDSSNYYNKLLNWFSTNSIPSHNYINDFLSNLDNFNLSEYIKAIHFDEIKVPVVPFYRAFSKTYYGIEEMKKGELDFFKATVLSKNNDSIFMCSDMPMEDMAQDIEFGKKWMYAIAIMLKKGLHLNIIHNLDRPFNEMMLGLESWLPIYMTGQISPYFFKRLQDNIYCHFNYVSGTVALFGECINGYHDKGKYTLTTNKTDISYYKTKAECLLRKATPLMEIYKEDSKNAYNAFLASSVRIKANRRRILSSLPIHTISDDLLLRILKHNNISDEEIERIKKAVDMQKNILKETIENNIVKDEFSNLSLEEFETSPLSLFLADNFYEKKIYYTYEEYQEHLNLTKKYEKNNNNYKLSINNNTTFKNIQILIFEKNFVMISKANSPSIHFVIHHPKLRNAIENFIPPIVE
ncbi:MAG: hypothetical protein U0O04_05605 [Clostridia bacterium]|jgi:transcriptional regulator with XRE-family HTH domain